MINVDFLNINNSQTLARLLPFWARGRKLSLLMQSFLSPLETVHRTFKAWALERFIDSKITAQRPSLEWYLKHKLQYHFYNPEDTFSVIQGLAPEETDEHKDMVIESDKTYVFAPAIVDTINYDHEDYERDIRNIMSSYMINFNKIIIIINTL